jgi:hypothetical protein
MALQFALWLMREVFALDRTGLIALPGLATY